MQFILLVSLHQLVQYYHRTISALQNTLENFSYKHYLSNIYFKR